MLRLKLPKIRNKRGAEDMIVDFWAILIFAIIVIIFLIWFSIDKGNADNMVHGEFASKDVQFMLESFLSAPLVDNPGKTVSDVIVEDTTTGNFTRTKKLFYDFFERTHTINDQEINDINLRIDGDHSDTSQITEEKGKGAFGKATTVAWELVKTTFVNSIASVGQQTPNIVLVAKQTDSYVADTYLPSYEKRIHVQISIVSWTSPSTINLMSK